MEHRDSALALILVPMAQREQIAALRFKEFCDDFAISQSEWRMSGYRWSSLQDIYEDYVCKWQDQVQARAASVANTLQLCRHVHAVQYRIKSGTHLIEKLIRKAVRLHGGVGSRSSVRTYLVDNRDFLGARALLIFKKDWPLVDKYIRTQFRIRRGTEVHLSDMDAKQFLVQYPKRYPKKWHRAIENDWYRSVHYPFEFRCNGKTLIGEIQVRSMFEDAWGEISHAVDYPKRSFAKGRREPREIGMLRSYLAVIGRNVGAADLLADAMSALRQMANVRMAGGPGWRGRHDRLASRHAMAIDQWWALGSFGGLVDAGFKFGSLREVLGK